MAVEAVTEPGPKTRQMERAGLVIATAQGVLDVAEDGVVRAEILKLGPPPVTSGSTAAATIPREQARPSLTTTLSGSRHLSVQATSARSILRKPPAATLMRLETSASIRVGSCVATPVRGR